MGNATYEMIDVNDFMKQHEKSRKKTLSMENSVAYTPKEYATLKRKHVNTIMAMLKAGSIPNAEKMGRRWLIYVPKDNSPGSPDPEEYQKLKEENIRLQALLDGINRMSQWKEQ